MVRIFNNPSQRDRMPPIKLPPVPATAYNEKRPANALLISQVHMLERAVRAAGRRVVSAQPKTEAQVAAWIRELNRALHKQVLLPMMKRRPLRPSTAAGGAGLNTAARAARKPAKARAARKTGPRRAPRKAARKQGRKR
jgi:hypothetical protein